MHDTTLPHAAGTQEAVEKELQRMSIKEYTLIKL